jgi:hypothetical protein
MVGSIQLLRTFPFLRPSCLSDVIHFLDYLGCSVGGRKVDAC